MMLFRLVYVSAATKDNQASHNGGSRFRLWWRRGKKEKQRPSGRGCITRTNAKSDGESKNKTMRNNRTSKPFD